MEKQQALKVLLWETAKKPFKEHYYKDILKGDNDVAEFEAGKYCRKVPLV